jgi:S-DNA-T family DNA segregation ATPase FtsK/SpoIIIE
VVAAAQPKLPTPGRAELPTTSSSEQPAPSSTEHPAPSSTEQPAQSRAELSGSLSPVKSASASTTPISSPNREEQVSEGPHTGYIIPPLELLTLAESKGENPGDDGRMLLERTFASFGVEATVVRVIKGPSLRRYEVQPAPGVKVSRIVALTDDIALNLAAANIRMEAPVPGKSVVGIEVPNKEIEAVTLREVMGTSAWLDAGGLLPLVFGKDITGSPVIGDLTRMPHLLIAGATGSGKSVCINTIIASILFKAGPETVKLLLIDPKRVEMTTYSGIPHLIAPVVTEAAKAAGALKWIVREMEMRYERFAAGGVRDISGYNRLAREAAKAAAEAAASEAETNPETELAIPRPEAESVPPLLPFIVVIIDELADLMMVAPTDVEDAICRLAQMARAAGIHLIVATQRPSVNVITGLIKANIPSRIAFAVSSQVDSRTIIDMGGAEKLLGRGDMLYHPMGVSKPLRVQGCFISDEEVERLTDFIKLQAEPEYREIVVPEEESEEDLPAETDPLLGKAALIFVDSNMASASLLQRKLRVGYARASRLVDMLEERRVIGAFEGSKPRAVLMSRVQIEQLFGHVET